MKGLHRALVVMLGLLCILIAVPGWAVDNTSSEKVVKKYPAYPDVWDWVTPFPSRMSREGQADLLPDGEVQLSYRLKSKSPKPTEDDCPRGEEHSFLFFSKRAVSPPKDILAPHDKGRVILPNGTIIRSSGGGGQLLSFIRQGF